MGPTLEKDQDLLESTQKFACKLMTKTWDRGYDELLNMTNLPSLKVATSKLVASKWSHSQSSAAVIET